MTITTQEVAALAEKATPGPLGVSSINPDEGFEVVRLSDGAYAASYCTEGDAKLFAAAPDMATLIVAQEARIERLRGALALAANRLGIAGCRASVDREHNISNLYHRWAIEARAEL